MGGKTRRPRDTGPTAKVRRLVHARSGRVCEAAGCSSRAVNLHHRRPRRAGGSTTADTNCPANLIDLCAGHHDLVESRRTEALGSGLLLHARQNPATVPVLTRHHPTAVLLDNVGGWAPAGAAAA